MDNCCLPKLNGNMPAGQEQRRRIIQEIVFQVVQQISTVGILPMSENMHPTPGGSTICMGMFINGAGTGMGIIVPALRLILKDRHPAQPVWHVAGLGMQGGYAVQLIGVASVHPHLTGAATSKSVFGWCGMHNEGR